MKKEKPRILLTTSTFPRWQNDTTPPFIYFLAKYLAYDFEVHVLAPHDYGAKLFEKVDQFYIHRYKYFFQRYQKFAYGGGILSNLYKNPLKLFQLPFFFFFQYFSILKLTKKYHFSCLNAHWVFPQGFIARLAKLTSSNVPPLVVTSHGSDINSLVGLFWDKLRSWILKDVESLVVVSKDLQTKIKSTNPSLDVFVQSMGVDEQLFFPSNKNLNLIKKYKLAKITLLFVGRLSKEKGVIPLIKSFKKVTEINPQSKLLIIGGGKLKIEIISLINHLNLNENVILLGPISQNQLNKYFNLADLFIMPSINEGFGLTAIEASLSQTKVLTSDVGGLKEIQNLASTNLLFPITDLKKLDRYILDAISTKISFKLLSSTRNKLLKKYSWKNVSKRYGEFLKC